jgi:hypothetical protein
MKDKENQIEFGVQECSKCKYKLRCEECVYNEKDINELIKFERQQERKQTATEFYDKFNKNICYFELKNKSTEYKEGYIQAVADICGKLDKTAIELGVDLREYYGKL